MANKTIEINDTALTSKIFGSFDKNILRVEKEFSVTVNNRQSDISGNDILVISGAEENVSAAAEAIKFLKRIATLNDEITDQNVDYVIDAVKNGRNSELDGLDDECICVTSSGKPVKAKTFGQKKYIESIKKNTIVFGVGPAGTGKTYLAVAMAVKALKNHDVTRIILTRPAVESGERLGFLPGDLQSKIDPYLRPLYDALFDFLGAENCAKLIEKKTIEIAPLAYMRGRTLDDSFIILDEAQNTTQEQMKMFLTRLGNGSRIVVTGDLTQTDLPADKKSGLATTVKILDGIDDIEIYRLTERDVVRHRLVQKIIVAYDKFEKSHAKKPQEKTQKFKYSRNTDRRKQQ